MVPSDAEGISEETGNQADLTKINEPHFARFMGPSMDPGLLGLQRRKGAGSGRLPESQVLAKIEHTRANCQYAESLLTIY
jgi:hypothetical protein